MLICKDLFAKYGKKEVLKPLSFACDDGSLTVVFGKNGAGKSTLLRCLAEGHPYGGSLLLDGQEVSRLSPAARGRRMGYLPQILPETEMTVWELCLLGRYPHRPLALRPSEEDLAAAERALCKTGMRALRHRRVLTLSGGERQRAFLAMLLAGEAKTLLFDEPTAALDPEAAREILDLLVSLTKEGCCVLAVMHDLSRGIRIADRLLLLDGGSLAFSGTREELLSTRLVEDTFGVRRYRAEDHVFFA